LYEDNKFKCLRLFFLTEDLSVLAVITLLIDEFATWYSYHCTLKCFSWFTVQYCLLNVQWQEIFVPLMLTVKWHFPAERKPLLNVWGIKPFIFMPWHISICHNKICDYFVDFAIYKRESLNIKRKDSFSESNFAPYLFWYLYVGVHFEISGLTFHES